VRFPFGAAALGAYAALAKCTRDFRPKCEQANLKVHLSHVYDYVVETTYGGNAEFHMTAKLSNKTAEDLTLNM
jgi:hypothetical protein